MWDILDGQLSPICTYGMHIYVHIVCEGFIHICFLYVGQMKWNGMDAHNLMGMQTFFVLFLSFHCSFKIFSNSLVHRGHRAEQKRRFGITSRRRVLISNPNSFDEALSFRECAWIAGKSHLIQIWECFLLFPSEPRIQWSIPLKL